ncbi:MAG: hypothetical protein HQL31_05935 [Planctomycetes bacterium]|nr:hypothetical protein [Planctomycetota bacterium]
MNDWEWGRALEELRKVFAPVLTSCDTTGLGVFDLQLEVLKQVMHRVSTHRISITTYSVDRLIRGRKILLHRAGVFLEKRLAEIGVYARVTLSGADLWRIHGVIQKTGERDVQVLLVDELMREILENPELRSILPSQLMNLDLIAIEEKETKMKFPLGPAQPGGRVIDTGA